MSAVAMFRWTEADYEERLDLLHVFLMDNGATRVPKLALHFGADPKEVAAKLRSIRSQGFAHYSPATKLWRAV